jgi:coenzyme F420-0:L-glutamate ligase
LPPRFVQVVIDEADRVIGGVKGVLLTVTAGDATANSGVDRKNAPSNTVVLWPKNPDLSARKLNNEIRRRFKKKVGVVIADSRVAPLRLGTIGLAIGCSGFCPLKDFRNERDIYGRKIQITFQAVADSIATAAQLVMGEADEKVPFALVRDAPVDFGSRSGAGLAKLDAKNCLYMSQIGNSI